MPQVGIDHVAVEVHRHRRRCMPEYPLHHLRVRASADGTSQTDQYRSATDREASPTPSILITPTRPSLTVTRAAAPPGVPVTCTEGPSAVFAITRGENSRRLITRRSGWPGPREIPRTPRRVWRSPGGRSGLASSADEDMPHPTLRSVSAIRLALPNFAISRSRRRRFAAPRRARRRALRWAARPGTGAPRRSAAADQAGQPR